MHERLERLRRKLAKTEDPDDQTDLEAAIAALEEKLGVKAMPAGDTITVGDLTQVTGVAVGFGARAAVYIDGRQGKTNDELFAAYYQRLVKRCQTIPFQGIYEQLTLHNRLDVELSQVYTQLATTTIVKREQFTPSEWWQAYFEGQIHQYVGQHLLPYQQRVKVKLFGFDEGSSPKCSNCGYISVWHMYCSECATQFVIQDTELLLFASKATIKQVSSELMTASKAIFYGPQIVSEAIAGALRVVLLGEPGSGKSTALRYLAFTLARAGLDPTLDLPTHLAGWSHGRMLPIFVPLLPLARRFANDSSRQGDAEDLWGYLAEHLQPQGANAGLAAAVHEQVEAGRVILLLDGLDEVAGMKSRQKVVRAVNSFAARYPDCRIVVACRVRAYEGERNTEWNLPGWPIATLADWTIGQMQTFVRAWYECVAEQRDRSKSWRDERIVSLTRAITLREDLQRFGQQPLMLTVMALVHLNDGRLPEERASLYSRCIDLLLGQWEIAGKDASEFGTLMDYIGLPDNDAQSFRPLLGRAAYEAHRAAKSGEVGRLSRPVLRTMVDDELKRRGHPNASLGADNFLVYTDLRAGLIRASDAADEYVFPHQTFQEYLAGIELVSGIDPVVRILSLRNDDRWRRPITLGIEQLALSSLDVPFRLLSRLIEEPNRAAPQRAFDLLLAQEIGANLGWNWLEQRDLLFARLKQHLAQALAETLDETTVSTAELVQAGAALAILGDPRSGVCDLPPAMVPIQGGSVSIGLTPTEIFQLPEDERSLFSNAENNKLIYISGFDLARYPVTNAQYKLFMDSGGYNPVAPWWDEEGCAWLLNNNETPDGLRYGQYRSNRDRPELWDSDIFGITRPNYPVVGISWYEATSFCRWLTEYLSDGYSYFLPSEAEWEYAGRGMNRRTYPWGDSEPDGTRANYNRMYGFTSAVGCFPAGATPEGLLDLAGNIWECTQIVQSIYPDVPANEHQNTDELIHKSFIIRGGSWGAEKPSFLRTACRIKRKIHVDINSDARGFRLARRPLPQ